MFFRDESIHLIGHFVDSFILYPLDDNLMEFVLDTFHNRIHESLRIYDKIIKSTGSFQDLKDGMSGQLHPRLDVGENIRGLCSSCGVFNVRCSD